MPTDISKLQIARWGNAATTNADPSKPKREQLFPGMRSELATIARELRIVSSDRAICGHGHHECERCKPKAVAPANRFAVGNMLLCVSCSADGSCGLPQDGKAYKVGAIGFDSIFRKPTVSLEGMDGWHWEERFERLREVAKPEPTRLHAWGCKPWRCVPECPIAHAQRMAKQAEPAPFKVGDRVRCVEASTAALDSDRIDNGCEYVVDREPYSARALIHLQGQSPGCTWKSERFVLAEPAQPVCEVAKAAGLPAHWRKALKSSADFVFFERVDQLAGVWPGGNAWTAGRRGTTIGQYGPMGDVYGSRSTAREAAELADRKVGAAS